MTLDPVEGVRGVLLDLDGTITVSWRAIAGAAETLAWLRSRGIPFVVATNATSRTRSDVAGALSGAGLEVSADEVVTAALAAAAYLRANHPGQGVFAVGGRGSLDDVGDIDLVDEGAGVVLIGGADDDFTWRNLSRAFRLVLGGAALVAMHRNVAWMTEEGMQLDTGAFLMGLERAAGVQAAVVGKPSPAFFEQCLVSLGLPAGSVAMVGDDLEADVLAAKAVGMRGVLVRTGKFRSEELEVAAPRPDAVIDSIAELPRLLA